MPSKKVVLPLNGSHITGILDQVDDSVQTRGRPIALILHGTLAHKNQTYHRQLAAALLARNLDSFRFDFHAHDESPGEWKMIDTEGDMADMLRVTEYLCDELGYVVHLLVAHSRGSAVAQRYLCKYNREVPFFINISGRRRMERIWDRWPVWREQIEEKGHYDWHVKIAGKKLTVPVTVEQIKAFAAYDNTFIETETPSHTHILSCHGTLDETVPVEDAALFHETWSKRSPGTSSLKLIEAANHNYIKRYDDLVTAITHWLDIVDARPKL